MYQHRATSPAIGLPFSHARSRRANESLIRSPRSQRAQVAAHISSDSTVKALSACRPKRLTRALYHGPARSRPRRSPRRAEAGGEAEVVVTVAGTWLALIPNVALLSP